MHEEGTRLLEAYQEMEYQRNALITKLESSRKRRKAFSPGKFKRSKETDQLRKQVAEL